MAYRPKPCRAYYDTAIHGSEACQNPPFTLRLEVIFSAFLITGVLRYLLLAGEEIRVCGWGVWGFTKFKAYRLSAWERALDFRFRTSGFTVLGVSPSTETSDQFPPPAAQRTH